jgi:hypothetical protein
VAPAGQRHQPRPRDPGRQVTTQPEGDGPVVAPVQHQGGCGHPLQQVLDAGLIALGEQVGGDLGRGRAPLQPDEVRPGVGAGVGQEDVGEHVRAQPPVGPDQGEHGRSDLGGGDLVAVGVAAVQDQPPDPGRVPGRERDRQGRGRRDAEQVEAVQPQLVGDRLEHLQVGVERLAARPRVRQPAAGLVVLDDGPAGGQGGEEGADGRVLPQQLQVADPGRRDQQRRTPTEGGVGDPHPAGCAAEPDLACRPGHGLDRRPVGSRRSGGR